VDPIDGTARVLSGSSDWSIAIALLQADAPLLGLVHAPAHRTVYAAERGRGATRNGHPIQVSDATALDGVSVAGPVPFITRLERRAASIKHAPRVPSLALRSRASPRARLISASSLRTRATGDIAGAHLVLEEAGGALTGLDGRAPVYNAPEPVHGELVASSRALHRPLVAAITGA
jgi:myo-inositol-1(or 4)-monophosphatase